MDPLVLVVVAILIAGFAVVLWLRRRDTPPPAAQRRSAARAGAAEVSFRVKCVLPLTALPGDVDRETLRGLRALLADVELADRLRLQVDNVDEVVMFVTVMAVDERAAERETIERLRGAGLVAMIAAHARRDLH